MTEMYCRPTYFFAEQTVFREQVDRFRQIENDFQIDTATIVQVLEYSFHLIS